MKDFFENSDISEESAKLWPLGWINNGYRTGLP